MHEVEVSLTIHVRFTSLYTVSLFEDHGKHIWVPTEQPLLWASWKTCGKRWKSWAQCYHQQLSCGQHSKQTLLSKVHNTWKSTAQDSWFPHWWAAPAHIVNLFPSTVTTRQLQVKYNHNYHTLLWSTSTCNFLLVSPTSVPYPTFQAGSEPLIYRLRAINISLKFKLYQS